MKLEYMNGARITKLYHEMTPLEAAISRYEDMAKEHYTKETAENTTLTEKERKEELKQSLAFLQLERDKLNTISDVQAQLEEYREAGMAAVNGSDAERESAIKMMTGEAHHPTDILEKYMRAEGEPKPSPEHTAHHIVPGKGKLKVITSRTRLHLHINGIRINDPANGVYLLNKNKDAPHWSMPKSKGHLTYHTHDYERWINVKLTPLNSIDVIKTQLQIIGRLLQANEPKTAIPKTKKA